MATFDALLKAVEAYLQWQSSQHPQPIPQSETSQRGYPVDRSRCGLRLSYGQTPEEKDQQKAQHQEAIAAEAIALLSELRYLRGKWVAKTIDAIDVNFNGLKPLDDSTMEKLAEQIDELLSLYEYIEAAAAVLDLPYQSNEQETNESS